MADNNTTTPKDPVNLKPTEVVVEKDLLRQVLEKQQLQDETIDKQKKEIERLTAAADKGRLVQYDMEHGGGTLIRTAKINIWQGFPVMGWQMVEDRVGKIDNVLREIQTIRLFCDEGKKELVSHDVDYLEFARTVQKVDGEIIEQAKTKSGEAFTIQLVDGKQYKMDIRFIN